MWSALFKYLALFRHWFINVGIWFSPICMRGRTVVEDSKRRPTAPNNEQSGQIGLIVSIFLLITNMDWQASNLGISFNPSAHMLWRRTRSFNPRHQSPCWVTEERQTNLPQPLTHFSKDSNDRPSAGGVLDGRRNMRSKQAPVRGVPGVSQFPKDEPFAWESGPGESVFLVPQKWTLTANFWTSVVLRIAVLSC